MVVSVNAPKAVEEEPVLEEGLEDGEAPEGEESTDEAGGDDSAPTESEENKEDNLKVVMYKLCIVGLGNPGTKYNNTRHNIGKDWLKDLSHNLCDKFIEKSKYEAKITESHSGEVLWLIPTNYMNESARTISKLIKSTNLKSNNIINFHDDLDLKIGDIRIKEGGGHGGHIA